MKRFSQLFLLPVLLVAMIAGVGWFLIHAYFQLGQSPLNRELGDLSPDPSAAYPGLSLPAGVRIHFTDVARKVGIDFYHFDGRTEMQHIMETTGPGLGWIDYDQDGLMDLFLVQGSTFIGPAPSPAPMCKLYKNMGAGKFVDVTDKVGLGHSGCGQGVAVGDIDNDGFPDLFLTCYGKPNVLYHNESDGHGGRRFVDITARAGMAEHPDWLTRPNWSTSAAFLDYNNDGFLDLFVCSYVKIDKDKHPKCKSLAGSPGPCPPSRFEGTRCVLYKNNGNGTFSIASKEAGIDVPNAKALGVVALDLDDDGLIDIFVANDTVPNFLFRNLGGGRFEQIALASGCAVNGMGMPQAYMGVDADDLHGHGRPDLFVTAFSRETNTIFRNDSKCQFFDAIQNSGMGPASWFKLGFGTCFIDVDRDGCLDIFVCNGHVARDVELDGDPNITFKQNSQLFLNKGRNGQFVEISHLAGDYFQNRYVGRGVAPCDYDNDGHMDLAISNSGGETVLLHNESQNPNHWVRLELRGTRSNRDAVGARVILHLSDGRKIVRHRKGGGSYLSASDPRLLVGLGSATRIEKVEIRWPLGQTQVFGPFAVDRGYLLVEGGNDKVTR